MEPSTPTLKYTGKGDVIRKVRLAKSKSYCVSMVDFMGCGRFKVRVSEPGKPLPFAEVSYVNLAAFIREWSVDQ